MNIPSQENPYQAPPEIVRAELVNPKHAKVFPWTKFYASLVACIVFALFSKDIFAAQELAIAWSVAWSCYGIYFWLTKG